MKIGPYVLLYHKYTINAANNIPKNAPATWPPFDEAFLIISCFPLGTGVGGVVGPFVGIKVGDVVGIKVGESDGGFVGLVVGLPTGLAVGLAVAP